MLPDLHIGFSRGRSGDLVFPSLEEFSLGSYRTPEVRGGSREGIPHVQEVAAARAQEGREELLHVKVRRGHREKISLVQSKEQRLRFAGAAIKRYPTS